MEPKVIAGDALSACRCSGAPVVGIHAEYEGKANAVSGAVVMGAGASSTRAADNSAGIHAFANATGEDNGTGSASSGPISDADAVRLPERVFPAAQQSPDDVSATFQMDPDIVGTHRSHERIERLHRHFIRFLPDGASPVYLAGAEGCGSQCASS
eukprot:SAG31_NODE_9386_length_1286_cov_1.101938_2_plen_155_part_00